MRTRLLPILRRHSVSVYVCGDDHSLQVMHSETPRQNSTNNSDIKFVVSGTGSRLEALKKGGLRSGVGAATLFQAKTLGFVDLIVSAKRGVTLTVYDENAEVLHRE
jgi:hypothetical protein